MRDPITSIPSFDTHRKTHLKDIHGPGTSPKLDDTQKQAIALTSALSSVSKNLYSQVLKFRAKLNEVATKLKQDNNRQKQEDKLEVEKKQKDRENNAWLHSTAQAGAGFLCGGLTATSELGNNMATNAFSKLEQAGSTIFNEKGQRLTYGIDETTKKQDAGRDRNRNLSDIEGRADQSASRIVDNHQRTFGEGRVNN